MSCTASHNPAKPTPVGSWLSALLLLLGTGILLPHGDLHAFGTVPWFLAGAGTMLAGFFLALRVAPTDWRLVIGVALATRVILLFQMPGDDIYRYIWEGRILAAGWNPYLHPPDAESLAGLRDAIWDSVQHKTFSAIYPPLAEWVFAALALVHASPLVFKTAFLVADLLVAWLLMRRFGSDRAFLYAWNPLVIYSFAGGGHYDSLFVLALVVGWFAWMDGRKLQCAGWLGAAVALKWLALPILAWVGWKILLEGWSKNRRGEVVVAALAGAAPLAISFIAVSLWTGEWTLRLGPPKFSQYARSAEFVPGIVGYFWELSKYHNQWFLVPLAVGWIGVILRGRDFARSAQWIFFLAFVLTPMLHAWYITWMVPLAVATRNRGILAVSASGFVYFLLYHHVETPGGAWMLRPWETALLWLPFVVGFLWSAWEDRKRARESLS